MTEAGSTNRIRGMSDRTYDIHKEMWGLFPGRPDSNRDFIYCVMDDGRTVYMVSASEPVFNESWSVESKAYNPIVSVGDVYSFRLKANPTVANSTTGKHQRHDVVMDLKRRLRQDGIQKNMAEIEAEAVSEWMVRKGGLNGFAVEPSDLSVHSYEAVSFPRQNERVSFSTVVIEGRLVVTEPDAFRNALFNGIGTAKGFGCGLLMIRRT